MDDYRDFFEEVCSLVHVKDLDDERFDPRLYASVLRSFKQALKMLVWDQGLKQTLVACFSVVHDNQDDDDSDSTAATTLHGGGDLIQMDMVTPPEHVCMFFSPTASLFCTLRAKSQLKLDFMKKK